MSGNAESDPMPVVRRGLRVFAIAVVLLAVFNSDRLRSTVRDYPANALTDRLVLGVDRWHQWMEAIGAARVAPALRRPFETVHESTW